MSTARHRPARPEQAHRKRVREERRGGERKDVENGIRAGGERKSREEESGRSKMKQKALGECDQYTSKYAECAVGRTLSVVWHCRKEAKELNDCLHQYTNDSVLEEMKRNYMLQQDKKRA